MKFFLIGLPGSGKSTLGGIISRKLNLPYFDTDKIITTEQNKTIDEIFATTGEQHFRELEKSTLYDLCEKNPSCVVSTGGGLPCFFENMDKMNQEGITIFLNVSPDVLAKRISEQNDVANRPMFKGKTRDEIKDFLQRRYNERQQYYSKSTIEFGNDNLKEEELLEAINKWI